ncbi:AsmA family protein [candidate division KSB1 bacterium]|nr:AsmA family protein [candidate division KSB1 bacterium]
MAKAKKEKKSAKTRKQKITIFFWRCWIFLGLLLILIFILFFFAFRFLIPSDYIKNYASRTMEQKYSRKMVIDKVQINPFTGFEFTNVKLERVNDTPDEFPVNYASINRIRLNYSLKRLLKKHILINEVILDSPDIDLNISAVPDTSQKEKDAAPDTVSATESPFSLQLKVLRLKDAQIKVTAQDSSVTQKMYLADLDLFLDDFNLPKGNIPGNDSLLTGKVKMTSENADFSFEQKSNQGDLFVTGNIDLRSGLNIATLDSITMDFKLVLDKLFLRSNINPDFTSIQIPFPLSLEAGSEVSLGEEKIRVNQLKMTVGNEIWLGLNCRIDGFMSQVQPPVSVDIHTSHIPVTQLLTLAEMFVPDSLRQDVYFVNKKAAISLAGSRISGVLPDSLSNKGLDFYAKLQFLDFGMTLNHGQMELLNLNLKTETSGTLAFLGLEGLHNNTVLSLDSLYYALSDTFSVYSGGGLLTLDADLNEYMLLKNSELNFSLANLLGAELNGRLSLRSDNGLSSVKGDGEITLSDIDLANFPQAPLETRAMLEYNLNVNTLDSISTSLKIKSDSLVIPFQFEKESLPSINFITQMELRSDTTFQNIVIKSLTVKLNDLLTARAEGRVRRGGSDGITMILKELQVSHQEIFDWLPDRIRERYSDLNVTGSTQLQGDFYGKITPDMFDYHVNAHLFTENTDIVYPAQFINISGVKLNVLANTQATGKSTAHVSLLIDSTQTDNLSKSAFLNNSISFSVYSPDLTSLQVDSGRINLPDMKAQGSFGAFIKQLDVNPHIYAHVEFRQFAKDTIKITRDIALHGITDLTANVEMDTSFLDLAGSLNTKELTVYLPSDTKVQNINADFKFQQKMDLINKIFIESEKPPILTPTDGSIDYLVYRPYYRKSLKELSYLSIEKIQAAGYMIDNFTLEALLGKGRVDVPSFFGKLYGGDFGGRISINLAGGDINQATYDISAHFSGINSDLLLPDIKREKTLGVINANAQFSGIGLNPEKGIDIKGDLYITEIGPKVADNLLRSLDPEGTDSGIRTTRRLINLGFKPQLFTFSFKYGFFYTYIDFSQPWYFPAKLSGSKIELNRKPVNFFIQMALAKPAG